MLNKLWLFSMGLSWKEEIAGFFYSFLFCDYVHSSWSRTDKHEKPKQLDGMQSRLQWNGDDRRKKEGANECKFIANLCTINIYSMMASNWAITNCNLHSLFSLFLLFVFFFLLHNYKSNFVVVLVCSRSRYGCWTSNFTKIWFSFFLSTAEELCTLRQHEKMKQVSLTNQPERVSGFQSRPISFACEL